MNKQAFLNFSEILDSRELRYSRDSSCEKTPFVMTPFSAPKLQVCDLGVQVSEEIRMRLGHVLRSPCRECLFTGASKVLGRKKYGSQTSWAGKKKAYTALLQCRTLLCRKKKGVTEERFQW